MNADQLARIPDRLLTEDGTPGLRKWLAVRGLRMTLEQLEDERARRGLRRGGRRR